MSRPRSLQLLLEDLPADATADGPASLRVVIFNSLMDAGIDRALIEGIECLSKKLWFIVFKERVQRQKYINKDIQLYLKVFTLKSTDVIRPERPRYTYVKVFGYPLDTKADLLEQSLSLYGKLIEVTDDIDTTIMIKTGVKTAKFANLKENIPSFIYAGRYHVRTAYTGQPKTCRNCSKTGHLAKYCQAGKVCRMCGNPGHSKGDCPEKRCYVCKEKGHEQSQCAKYAINFPSLTESTEETQEKTTKPNESGTTTDSQGKNDDWNADPEGWECEKHESEDKTATDERTPQETAHRTEIPPDGDMDTDKATAQKPTTAKGDKAKATGENTPETTTEVTMETGQESGKKDDTVTKQIENNKTAELHVSDSDTESDNDTSVDDPKTGGKRKKKGGQTKPKKPRKTPTVKVSHAVNRNPFMENSSASR